MQKGKNESIILDYSCSLSEVHFHPLDSSKFIVGSEIGDVRLYDLRKIVNSDPRLSYLNIYRNVDLSVNNRSYDVTGCSFSQDGSEIICTVLNDKIYVFDTNTNYEHSHGCNYWGSRSSNLTQEQLSRQAHREIVGSFMSILRIISQGEGEVEFEPSVFFRGTGGESHEDSPSESVDRSNDHMHESDYESDPSRESKESTEELKEESKESQEPAESEEPNESTQSKETMESPKYVEIKDQASSRVPRTEGNLKKVGGNVKTFKTVYVGHRSVNTVKGVWFYGPNSEYVISGSDDAKIYIWEKKTAKLLRILKGHKGIVNRITSHPTQPMFASSGIDNVIKVWDNVKEVPLEVEMEEKWKFIKATIEKNNQLSQANSADLDELCAQQ
eukprot:TRINITY_DN7548_c0_g1_i1.p1 TRINITY_DN7548_c0_g1~~TRINITY_DN7548_c0_g1_i1.p1  ORF type:complete len:386 (-),score=76.75 TRINITY_DN7548_c0_g1_i1:209-1366(-)